MNRISSSLARIVLFPIVCMLSVPAWSCPVATEGGDHNVRNLRSDNFSPLMSVRADDLVETNYRAQAKTECVGGFAGPYPCNDIDLLSFLPLSDIGGGGGNDIWGWTDGQTGKEYAIMGRTNGTSFVDISDPENPIYLGNLPSHSGNSTWRDLKVNKDHVFVVREAGGHGMQVFDLRLLRGLTGPPQTFSNTAHYAGFSSAHNIAINEESGFAYAVGTNDCSGGLHMIDVSNPTNPTFSGCYSDDGYTHDAQCVIFNGPSHKFHHGSELCFNSNTDTLTIVDVTNKSNPVMLARLPYPNDGYTHQGWLTEDHAYFLLDDELDENQQGHNTLTRVFDVANPEAPALLGTFESTAPAIDHNLYVKGDFTYQANYRAGLRILEILDPANATLKEEAFFDIYPSNDNPNFNGAWSVYPYYDSGVVVVSGIESGLFVLRPTSLVPQFTVDVDPALVEICGNESASADVVLDVFQGFNQPVELSLNGVPPGISAVLGQSTLVPPSTIGLDISVNGAQSGQYRLTLDATSEKQTNSVDLDLEVSNGIPGTPNVVLPSDGLDQVSSAQPLYWQPVDGAFRYDVEVSTDVSFSNIVASAYGLSQASYSGGIYPVDTTLYWRVTAHNSCGSSVSNTATFNTAGQECAVYQSTDVPKNISDNDVVSVTSALSTKSPGQIVDVNIVNLQGTHSFIGDLTFQLEGPLLHTHDVGVTRHAPRAMVTVINEMCGNLDDFDLNLDDESSQAIPCPFNDGGTYQPVTSLSPFFGNPGSGGWTLTVSDSYPLDGGSLQSWGLELCTTPVPLNLDSDADGIDDNLDNCINVPNPDQRDTHGDGYGNVCDADLNNDGTVNFLDLSLYAEAFNQSGEGLDADLNGDNNVNFLDLALMRDQFFGPPGPSGIAIQ